MTKRQQSSQRANNSAGAMKQTKLHATSKGNDFLRNLKTRISKKFKSPPKQLQKDNAVGDNSNIKTSQREVQATGEQLRERQDNSTAHNQPIINVLPSLDHIESFRGTGNWDDFADRFEVLMGVYKLSDSDLAQMLPVKLADNAWEIYRRSVTRLNPSCTKDYQKLKSLLSEAFAVTDLLHERK
jgi:hypothetical protein